MMTMNMLFLWNLENGEEERRFESATSIADVVSKGPEDI